jgi:putative ABC transport system permease protein
MDPGFDPDHLIAFQVDLPESEYLRPVGDGGLDDVSLVEVSPRASLLFDDLVRSLEKLQDVESVTAASVIPPSVGSACDFIITGHTPPDEGQALPTAGYTAVRSNFFGTMGARLLRGRAFSEHDTESSPQVVVINESLARRYWPNEDPVGRHIRIESTGDEETRTVIGVVSDLRNQGMSLHALPEMYVPYVQEPVQFPPHIGRSRLAMNYVARTRSSSDNLADTIRRAVAEVDPGLSISGLATMQERLDFVAQEVLVATILNGPIIALALALTAVGIYGVLSFSVSRRIREIGVRIAMGAGRWGLLKLIMGHGMKLVGIGIAIGLAGALALSRILSATLLDVASIDLLLVFGASTILVVVALIASYLPARRAAKVDPVIALRYE